VTLKYGAFFILVSTLFSLNAFSEQETFKVCEKFGGSCETRNFEKVDGTFFKTEIEFLGDLERGKDLSRWSNDSPDLIKLARLNSSSRRQNLARHTALRFCQSKGFKMVESATWFGNDLTGAHCSNVIERGRLISRMNKSTAIVCSQFLKNPEETVKKRPNQTCSRRMKKFASSEFQINLEKDPVSTSIPEPSTNTTGSPSTEGSGTK